MQYNSDYKFRRYINSRYINYPPKGRGRGARTRLCAVLLHPCAAHTAHPLLSSLRAYVYRVYMHALSATLSGYKVAFLSDFGVFEAVFVVFFIGKSKFEGVI